MSEGEEIEVMITLDLKQMVGDSLELEVSPIRGRGHY